MVDGHRGEGHSEEICGWHIEYVNDLVDAQLEVVHKKGVPLITGDVLFGGPEVNENRIYLQKRKVMKWKVLDGGPVRATIATARLASRIRIGGHIHRSWKRRK